MNLFKNLFKKQDLKQEVKEQTQSQKKQTLDEVLDEFNKEQFLNSDKNIAQEKLLQHIENVKKNISKMTMDSDCMNGISNGYGFGMQNFNDYSYLTNRYYALPPQLLSSLVQVPLVYNACDTYINELMRAEYNFVCNNKDKQDEKIIELLKTEYDKFEIPRIIQNTIYNMVVFGGSMLYPKYKNDSEKLDKKLNLDKGIAPDTLEYFTTIEPTWCVPKLVNYINPLQTDFYVPSNYQVMQFSVDESRLFKTIFKPVPDLIRPQYWHYGISLTQMIINAVMQFESVKDVILKIINRLNLTIYGVTYEKYQNNKTLLKQKLQNSDKVRDNFGTLLYDKDNEHIEQLTLSLQHLNELLKEYLGFISVYTQIPETKLTGNAPSGLRGGNDESSHRNWYDLLYGILETRIKPLHERIIKHILLNNGIDIVEYTVEFKQLYQPSDIEQAQVNKINADIDVAYAMSGIVDPRDINKKIQNDKDSLYSEINLSVPDNELDNEVKGMNEKQDD